MEAILSTVSQMRKLVTAALAGALTLAFVAAGGSAAKAGELYNDYTVVGLPQWLTGPATFTIEVSGPDAVCKMAFGEQELTSAPWTFTITPETYSWERGVAMDYCNTEYGQDFYPLDTEVPFGLGSRVYPNEGRIVEVGVRNNTKAEASFQITDAKGNIVAEKTTSERYETFNLEVKGLSKTTKYFITADGSGVQMSSEIVIPVGWNPLSSWNPGSAGGGFNPCSTITWSYDKSQQPKKANTMLSDVKKALAKISALSGLKFVQQPSDAQLTIKWGDLGKDGPSGLGGLASSNGVAAGSVEFNTKTWWAENRYAGFARDSRGTPGRGWLAVHEIMHAIGFGHVNDRTQVMNPVSYAVNFGKGDKEGFQVMYPKAGCS